MFLSAFPTQFLILSLYLSLNRRFNLIDPKETEVLRDLEIALHLTDDSVQAPPTGGAASDSVSMASATSTLTNTTAGSTMTSSSGIGGTDTSMSDSSMMSHTQIDGDALAQPICKQPLESGNDPVSLISSHHNNSSNHEQQQPMSCSGDATTTFMSSTNSDSNSDKGGGGGGQDTINAHLQSAA